MIRVMMDGRPDDGEPDAVVEFDLDALIAKATEQRRTGYALGDHGAAKNRVYMALKRLKERARDEAQRRGLDYRTARLGEVTGEGEAGNPKGIWRAKVFFDLVPP